MSVASRDSSASWMTNVVVDHCCRRGLVARCRPCSPWPGRPPRRVCLRRSGAESRTRRHGRAGRGCWTPGWSLPTRGPCRRGRPTAGRARNRRAEHGRHGVEQGADLGVAVALALYRCGVQPHRDVVDKDAAVDLAEIDDVLAAVDEGVEGSDDVIAVHPQIESEVVARTRRDTGEGQTVVGGRGGDDRLGAVPTRRGERPWTSSTSTARSPSNGSTCSSPFAFRSPQPLRVHPRGDQPPDRSVDHAVTVALVASAVKPWGVSMLLIRPPSVRMIRQPPT